MVRLDVGNDLVVARSIVSRLDSIGVSARLVTDSADGVDPSLVHVRGWWVVVDDEHRGPAEHAIDEAWRAQRADCAEGADRRSGLGRRIAGWVLLAVLVGAIVVSLLVTIARS